ncbi:hypothetical protein [uncultured Gammaproteobacteria bacterium]|nr:hypothetical protein [uncultured Gammaproteobacteria bacterium]
MNIDRIVGEFKNAEIALVKVAEFDVEDEMLMTFQGGLLEYVEAVKNLDSKVVFLSISTLSKEFFTINIGAEIDDYGSISKEIEITSINKKFKKYKKYINKNAYFHFLTTSKYGNLQFNIQEDWFNEFYELLEIERENIENHHINKLNENESNNAARQNELLQKVDSLKNDSNFCKCKTQIIKNAYALEKYPELKELDLLTLKSAISSITAAVEAKKMML